MAKAKQEQPKWWVFNTKTGEVVSQDTQKLAEWLIGNRIENDANDETKVSDFVVVFGVAVPAALRVALLPPK